MTFRSVLSSLRAHDMTVVCFGLLLSLLNLAFSSRIEEWWILIVVNIAVSLGIISIAYLDAHRSSKIIFFIHLWYLAPLVFLTFKELYLMIAPMHGRDYDDLFVVIDRWLFGVDPTIWLARFTHPLITEILQIAYTSYYLLLIMIGYELYRQSDRSNFLYYAFLVIFGFYVSYVGYLFLPAVGPRFVVHDFSLLNRELPGLLLTNVLRDFVNWGESIPPGVSNPIAYAQRDVFPSGHTMLMLVMMHTAVMYRMKVKWFVVVMGTLLIVSTVYLRYHYVIDVIAGVAFYGLCMWSAPWVYRHWERLRSRLTT